MNQTAEQKRDARIRRRMLSAAHSARVSPRGGLSARRLCDLVDDVLADDQKLEDDTHALQLLIDLRDGGYVELVDERTRKLERYGVDCLFVKVTDKGNRLMREEIPVDAAIEDDRIS